MRQLTITQSITTRDARSLDNYFQEIGKIQTVTAEEEVSLARRIKAGDRAALDLLTKANLRFVVSVAKQYRFLGLSLSDIINEGNIGLIIAAKRFDETKGFKFISYAVWWIRQSIIQAIQKQGRLVHQPANKMSLSLRIQAASAALEQDLERLPTTEELAALLDVGVNEIRTIGELNLYHTSLDAPLVQGEEKTLSDTLVSTGDKADVGMAHHRSLQIEVERSLRTLSSLEKEVICFFFGIGLTQAYSLNEIGEKYNLTTERVRQIKAKALVKLRAPKRTALLKSYLER